MTGDTMTQSDDWRRAATAEQMRSVVRTIDPSVAHIARIQDYWLGGKDHFEADRIPGTPGWTRMCRPMAASPARTDRH